jgi:hypothetical protein
MVPKKSWQKKGVIEPRYRDDYSSNYSLCLAVDVNGPVAWQVIKGGYNQFSMVYFFKGLIEILRK